MHDQVGLLGTPGVGLIGLIIIGGLAGWIGGKIVGFRNGLLTNILVGICGSALGFKLADVLDVAVAGRFGHFIAALAGSIVILFIWQALTRNR
ncbi:MAG: GlsB/YeaQ/YmgE family stress response membrane protein [Hyphomicrobiales bacterium]|nr:GlsB/YeaQ/YmgE family stress response membrane protein [Parvibaculum sp.]MBX3528144.1 GlsB/YeaQ/YmgE family stress response membrane protein [Rhodoblastus sp.]MCC0001305.1 GlsB/YeaQ/YmgE family stress response membrane protein [Methylobacteriaceae bacterium]MCC2104479.1 GlsB/YeaQ/YmgE family stress response membrane protein [Hyphomicrobiales bacterium]HRY03984.1 GlsB/YeaQ/YmgE family stress response membrane protein [Beijerinckiaceae bacterium]